MGWINKAKAILGLKKDVKEDFSFYTNQYPNLSDFDIGDGTYGRPYVHKYGLNSLTVGKYCSIGPNVRILLAGEHSYDSISTYPFKEIIENNLSFSKSKGEVNIGNDVWIGANVTILSGVKIGNGAVLAANALIASDVEPFSIVGGVPAKFIKYRFDPDLIEKIEDLAWWDWSKEDIIKNHELLISKDIGNSIFILNEKFKK